jgi:hypothetical protein
MRKALVATGILGTGTALTFGAAVLASSLLPPTPLTPNGSGWTDQPMRFPPGVVVPVPAPMPGKDMPGWGGGMDDGGWDAVPQPEQPAEPLPDVDPAAPPDGEGTDAVELPPGE